MKLLFNADPADGNGDTPPPAKPPKTSKEIIVGDDNRIKELETRVSDLQAKRQEDKTLVDSCVEFVSAAKRAPSARMPGKSLFDEVEDFLGFGQSAPVTDATPK